MPLALILLVIAAVCGIPLLVRRPEHARPSGPSTDPSLAPPSPGHVFGQVWWRSIVVATAGGSLIGAALGVVLLWSFGWGPAGIVFLPLLGGIFGAGFGLILGIAGGFVMAATAAVLLVPYPGPTQAARTMRVLASLIVLVYFLLPPWSVDLGRLGHYLVLAPSMLAAFLLSPKLVTWYERAMTSAPSRWGSDSRR